ncbi:MAG: aldehyde ferredoxin oxidoreductase family protein [Deltaproteobacteria bacterium]|nr:aldehyde ferredoxin oxidoreductase family protein [Deltaproteobacteria bacterium]
MNYVAKLARIDLDKGSGEILEVEADDLRKYIGGSGLGAKILWEETSAATGPFSPENRLMFMNGPLTGQVPQSSRTAVCGLSPANDGWGEAFVGGSWGAEFSRTGLLGIVIAGRASSPVYINIKNQEVRIEAAGHLWGKDSYETDDLLHREVDGKASVAAIGRAGERLVRFAGIVVDGRLGRVAARCGLGAVMGSKNLKAVVVRGTLLPAACDGAAVKAINREVNRRLVEKARGPGVMETREGVNEAYEWGAFGVRNGTRGRWEAFKDKFADAGPSEHYHCRLCPTSCLESHVKDGTRLPVMHMLMSAGSNCLIDDLDALKEGYDLCNRYGLDVISFGYTLSFAMEAFEKGLIDRSDTGGIDLTWGNSRAMLAILRQIGENEGFGKVLAQGSLRAARKIGKGAVRYALQVKGLEMPFWDLRVFNSLALGYATGNRGASHYESPGHIAERKQKGAFVAELGFPGGLKRLGMEDKAALIMKIQDAICLISALVVCQTSYQKFGVSLTTDLQWLNAITGWEMSHAEFLLAGERMFNLKRLINLRLGYTAKDDILPPRALEKLADLSDDEQRVPDSIQDRLQEYYALRGWDQDGAPAPEKLAALQLT